MKVDPTLNRIKAIEALKRWRIKILLVSVIVFLLIVAMGRIQIDTGYDLSFLAAFHSTINFITFFILLYALIMIKRKRIQAHRKAIMLAMRMSVLFLLSYIVYHMTVPELRYCGQGSLRIIYFIILSTHIILSAILLPFILFTFARAYLGLYDMHRKMARWVMPFWMYIAISGPVIYVMLHNC